MNRPWSVIDDEELKLFKELEDSARNVLWTFNGRELQGTHELKRIRVILQRLVSVRGSMPMDEVLHPSGIDVLTDEEP